MKKTTFRKTEMKRNEVMGKKYNQTIVMENDNFRGGSLDMSKTLQVNSGNAQVLKHDYFSQKLFEFIRRYN